MANQESTREDGLYAWTGKDYVRIESINNTDAGEVLGVIIDGSLDFYYAVWVPEAQGYALKGRATC